MRQKPTKAIYPPKGALVFDRLREQVVEVVKLAKNGMIAGRVSGDNLYVLMLPTMINMIKMPDESEAKSSPELA